MSEKCKNSIPQSVISIGVGISSQGPLRRSGPAARQLGTLKDAADYVMKLPKAEQNLKEWQTATEVPIMAAEGRGPPLHARIGVMRALNRQLNRHHPREFDLDRKPHHWGKRKLRRDE
jgi:hypothetical protein